MWSNIHNGNRQPTCCICHHIHSGYGNNPQPLIMKIGSRCCDECNQLVTAARLYADRNINSEEEMAHFERMPLRKKTVKIEEIFSKKWADRMKNLIHRKLY